MQVEDVMTLTVRHCSPETSLEAAIEIMSSHDGAELLVLEDGRVLGVVTERDICIALSTRNSSARDLVVREVRITAIQTCQPGDDVEVAMDFMRATRLRLVPVVDAEGILRGSVTLSDLIHKIEQEPNTTKWNKLLETLLLIGKYPVSKLAAEIETTLMKKI